MPSPVLSTAEGISSPLLNNSLPTQAVKPPSLSDFGDATTTRTAIYAKALDAAKSIQPIQGNNLTVSLHDIDYEDPEEYSLVAQKKAIMEGRTLGRRLRGTWRLSDVEGQTLEEKRETVATIPYMTPRGTFINNGNEYVLINQSRLHPGIYTRVKNNGEIEAHANILPGQGSSHRYFLDPDKGVFYARLGQSKVPLLPLLKELGVNEKQLREAWGDQLLSTNVLNDKPALLQKFYAKFLPYKLQDASLPEKQQGLVESFKRMTLDPGVMQQTLGKPYEHMSAEAILDTTKKLLAISRGESDVDDRDNLSYQTVMKPEDLLAERLAKDYGGLRKRLMRKAAWRGSLQPILPNALTKQVQSAILQSGLGQALEEVNTAELFDKQFRITRMGEGGMPGTQSVPDEARAMQGSHLGFIDPVRTAESANVGVDLWLARGAKKGDDGLLYAPFIDSKSGETVYKSPRDVINATVAFPRELQKDTKRVLAMKGGQIASVLKTDVDYSMPVFEDAFSPTANLIPMKSAARGHRAVMAARMTTQALALQNAEAPLVQSGVPGLLDTSYEQLYSDKMGALYAEQPGKVVSVDEGKIKLRYADGSTEVKELHVNFPFNRKSSLHQTPVVSPGDIVKPGSLLARSNYTDDKGTTALGLNALIAYLPIKGKNHKDAIVISESFAKKLNSEHMYPHWVEKRPEHLLGRSRYVGLFPGKYSKQQLESMNVQGIVKPGTEIKYGDPLILAARPVEKTRSSVHKKHGQSITDETITWDHEAPGIVTDVADTRHGMAVYVKSFMPASIGDKLSNRYGGKGVIADIIPDDQMPHTKEGRAIEMAVNSTSVISRGNPAQIAETILGKIAEKTGKPYKIIDFEDIDDITDFVQKEMIKHDVKDLDDLIDPETQRKITNVLTGKQFVMKLHHMSEDKSQGRGLGAYTSEDAPAKGGETGAKRISMQDTGALLSHSAYNVMKDALQIRGQRNEDFWLAFVQGHHPPQPKIPFVYNKFVNSLKASGINVVSRGTNHHIMALTDKDVDDLAGDRRIVNGHTVDFGKGLLPIRGGLFDPSLTGGHRGNRWSAIDLVEPMLNPVMEDPARKILGITQKQFENVLAGSEELPRFGGTGPTAIQKALKGLELDKEIAIARAQIGGSKKTARDQAIRKLGYLKSAKHLGIHPGDWILNKVPVLPPAFRPVSVLSDSKLPLVADANYLYKELLEANDNLKHLKSEVDDVGAERIALYKSFKAVTGLGEPISQELKEKKIKGILESLVGSSPKYGTMQRRLLSAPVDLVGRGVIIPDPDLDMDSVGLPEDKAWSIYKNFIIRRLKRRGMSLTDALRQVEDRSSVAKQEMLEEMAHRPVLVNRAPVLHRFGLLALRPRLTADNTVHVPPPILKGMGADHDGDGGRFSIITAFTGSKEGLISDSDVHTIIAGEEKVSSAWFSARRVPKSMFSKLPVAVANNSQLCVVDIEEFPHDLAVEKQSSTPAGIINWHRVPAGVFVLTTDDEGNPAWQEVTYWTEHVARQIWHVKLANGVVLCADDDPRSVFGVDSQHDESACTTRAPKDAVGLLVPVARYFAEDAMTTQDSLNSVQTGEVEKIAESSPRAMIKPEIELNETTGRFCGYMVGDGWVMHTNGSVKALCLANISDEILSAFEEALPQIINVMAATNISVSHKERKKIAGDDIDAYGSVKTVEFFSASAARVFVNWIGRGASNKHLPPFFFFANVDFRLGLLAGLMDTDGGISVSRAVSKKKPQLVVKYDTISERLAREVMLLCRSLGIRGTVTTYKATSGKTCYLISFNAYDFQHSAVPSHMRHPDRLRELASVVALDDSPVSARYDQIPMPSTLAAELMLHIGAPQSVKNKTLKLDSLYTSLSKAKKRGSVPRVTLLSMLEKVPSTKELLESSPQGRILLARIANENVTWVQVTAAEQTKDTLTTYDLSVPGRENFMSVDGVFLHNTVQYHVPVSEDARKEALERMLPSKNLLNPADFRSPMFIPGEEDYIGGLYAATVPNKKNRVHHFRSKEEAIKAYYRGDISADTVVDIN